jgi:hypothetical protein
MVGGLTRESPLNVLGAVDTAPLTGRAFVAG